MPLIEIHISRFQNYKMLMDYKLLYLAIYNPIYVNQYEII